MHRLSTILPPPLPSFEDDAFALTERVPRIVIECSKVDPIPRVHTVTPEDYSAAKPDLR